MSSSSEHDEGRSSEQAPCDAPDTHEPTTTETRQRKPPSPRKCRDYIRRETANAMPNIVNTFVGQARKGSVPHFNALAKVGGFDQRSSSAEAPKRKRRSLARQLLDEVEKYEAKQAAELAAANAAASQTGNLGSQEGS